MTSLKTLAMVGLLAGTLVGCGEQNSANTGAAPSAAKAPAYNIDTLLKTCATCHGDKGLATADLWPTLAGQKKGYLMAQLREFRDGKREDQLMTQNAKNLSDQDIEALASYYSQQVDNRAKPTEVNMEGARVRAHCISCHGKKGKTVNQLWPNLAGQQPGYLAKALMDYKTGKRKNPIMEVIASELNEQQIKDVAEYYSQQAANQGK